MKVLTQAEIKEEELKLLQTSGFSLGECTRSQNTSKILKELTNFIKVTEIERLRVSRMRNMGLSSNANLRSFGLVLLSSIYCCQLKEDLLDMVKSMLYHPSLDLCKVKHSPLPQVQSQQMKKIIVQFFYSLVYSSQEDKIQGKLCKYPIVMDILVLFLRSILIHLNVKHADNYLLKLPTKPTIETLINFFDLNCKTITAMFLLHEDKLFIYQNQNGETFVGNYSQNDGLKDERERRGLNLPYVSQQTEEDTDNEGSRRESYNRSLQFKESIVFDHEAPTPFFTLNFPGSSFESSHKTTHQQKNLGIQNQLKEVKEALKAKDMAGPRQENNFGNNSVKRALLQNQLKQSLQSKEQQAMDSPITLDSPHSLFDQGNFNKVTAEQIKMMKKSKSESGRPKSSHEPNEEQSQAKGDMRKKQKVQYGKVTRKRSHNCKCLQAKKSSMKLNSNLYEINMRYVTNQSKPQSSSTLSGQIYVNSKGLNCQIYTPAQTNTPVPIQPVRQNYMRQNVNLNASVNSCYAIPQSDTHSKKQFSPISNTGDRSFSPYGGSTCNNSPKIVFTYRNPLKYSVQLNPKHGKKV